MPVKPPYRPPTAPAGKTLSAAHQKEQQERKILNDAIAAKEAKLLEKENQLKEITADIEKEGSARQRSVGELVATTSFSGINHRG